MRENFVPDGFLDLPIAELERYGLDEKTIVLVEEACGGVYMSSLVVFSRDELREAPDIGPIRIKRLRLALNRCMRALHEQAAGNCSLGAPAAARIG